MAWKEHEHEIEPPHVEMRPIGFVVSCERKRSTPPPRMFRTTVSTVCSSDLGTPALELASEVERGPPLPDAVGWRSEGHPVKPWSIDSTTVGNAFSSPSPSHPCAISSEANCGGHGECVTKRAHLGITIADTQDAGVKRAQTSYWVKRSSPRRRPCPRLCPASLPTCFFWWRRSFSRAAAPERCACSCLLTYTVTQTLIRAVLLGIFNATSFPTQTPHPKVG